MKATAQTLSPTFVAERARAVLFAELIKARLTLLVLLTTLAGFYLGCRGPVSGALLFHTLLGTALLASGAAALNQFLERQPDAVMRRTKDRPIPSGRVQPASALAFGSACSVGGLLHLTLAVNLLTALLGAFTLGSYLFLYTPLKRATWLNTLVGAVPGGLPPLMGWTAARGEWSVGGWALFAILACWQLPHFFAIAWMYRDDYARAGFKMLPSVDKDGHRTARLSVVFTVALLAASAWPFALGLAGPGYLIGALGMGLACLACAIRFARHRTETAARRLFFASILYLPLLLVLLTLDKVK